MSTTTSPLSLPARLLAAVALAALAGCSGYGQAPTGSAATEAAPPPAAAQCNAQAAQFAVGQNSTASVMESARARSGAHMARILRPGQVTTMEFNAQRLNLEVDAGGRIVAARCG